jgi:hypothetical protein
LFHSNTEDAENWSEWSNELAKTISSWGVYEIASSKQNLKKITASNLNLIVIGENEYKNFGKMFWIIYQKIKFHQLQLVGSESEVKYLTEQTVDVTIKIIK